MTRAAERVEFRASSRMAGAVRIPLLAFLLLSAHATPSHAREEDTPLQLQAAVSEAMEALAELGGFCHRSKLYKERDKVAREILELDSDHARARKWLKFRRGKDGAWERRGPYREPRNLGSRAALKALPEKRTKLLEGPVERLWRLVEQHQDPDGTRTRAKSEALGVLIALPPEDARFREANGESLHQGRWVLKETATARRCHREIGSLVAKVRRRVPSPRNTSQTELEKRVPFAWQSSVATPEVRVLGTCAKSETVGVARTLHAARVLLRLLLRTDLPAEPELTVWLLTRRAEHQVLVEVLPLEPHVEARLQRCSGFWLPVGEIAVDSSNTAEGRMDGAVRMMLDHDLGRALPGLAQNEPLEEGLGIYLTHLLTGTRLSVMSEHTEYAEGDDRDDRGVDLGEGDWLRLAHKLVEQGELPPLRDVLGTPLNALEAADLVYANTLAQYLFEGRPGEVVAFLRQTESGGVANDAALEVLGLDVFGLDTRIRRWITEMAGAQ